MGRVVATSDPAEFEYDGSVLTTQTTGNALGFGSDPAEVIFSFSWTGTGPDSFSFNSPVQDPGEISLDTDGVTCAGQYIFNFTVTSTIISTGETFSSSDDAVVIVKPALGELIITGIIGEDKEYDGKIDAVIDLSGAELSSVITGDDLGLDYSGATATFDDANAGSIKAITVTRLILIGADAGNYIPTPLAVAVDIIFRELTIIANDCRKTFASSEFTFDGLVNGYMVTSLTLTSGGADEDATVGTYAIIPSEAIGTGSENYIINYVACTLTVNSKGGGGGLAWWIILLIVLATISIAGIAVW